jgi:hypothetical protein
MNQDIGSNFADDHTILSKAETIKYKFRVKLRYKNMNP